MLSVPLSGFAISADTFALMFPLAFWTIQEIVTASPSMGCGFEKDIFDTARSGAITVSVTLSVPV